MTDTPQKLKRQLGFWDSVAINVGIIIGVGIFRTPGSVAHFLDQPPLILFAWFLGGLIALLGVLCYAELSVRFPETGGTYIFLRETYGRLVGFVFGWVEFSILRAASIAAVAYIFTSYLHNFIVFSPGAEKAVTILIIGVFTAINAVGIKIGTGVQNVLSSLKILAILGITAVIFWLIHAPAAAQEAVPAGPHSYLWAGIAPAIIPILWSYGGWHQSTFMSGEFKDTKRALPLSLIASIAIVTLVYVVINAAYLRAMPVTDMAGSKAIASDILNQLFGPAGKWIISAVVLISAGGALNSTILTGARIPFAVAQDHGRCGWFAKIDLRFGTPLRALLLNSLWASVLVLWGNFEQLLFFFAFADWFFFALVGASVLILQRREAQAAALPGLGSPIIPVLFILSSLWVCSITVQQAPREALFGALLMLSGIPIYFLASGEKGIFSRGAKRVEEVIEESLEEPTI